VSRVDIWIHFRFDLYLLHCVFVLMVECDVV